MERQGLQIDKAESVLGRGGGGGSVVPAGAFGFAGTTGATSGAGMGIRADLDGTLEGGKAIPRGEVRLRRSIVGKQLGTQTKVWIEGVTNEADVSLVAGGRTIEAICMHQDVDGSHPDSAGKAILVNDGVEGLLRGNLERLAVGGPGLTRIECRRGGGKRLSSLTNHGPVEGNKTDGRRGLMVDGKAIEGGEGIPERGLIFLGAVQPSVKRGQECAEDASLMGEADGAEGGTTNKKTLNFLTEARNGSVGKLRGVATDGLEVGGADVKVELGGEADGAHHADGVFAEADVRVANGADAASLEVAKAADVVDDGEVVDVVEETVDGKVATEGIFLGCAEGVVFELVESVRLIGDGVRRRGLAEGGSLNDLFAKDDMGQAETTADEIAIAELALDFVGACVSTDVKIFWGPAKEQITNGTANEVGFVAELGEAVKNLKGIRVDVAARDVVLGSGDDGRFGLSVEEEHVADTFG